MEQRPGFAAPLLVLLLLVYAVPGCAQPEFDLRTTLHDAPDVAQFAPAAVEPDPDATLLIVHYRRADGNYDNWNLWAWAPDQQGAAHGFTQRDKFGAYTVARLPAGLERVGFIVRRGEWEAKDVDRDRWVEVDGRGIAEAWVVSGDEQAYDDPQTIDLSLRVRSAFLDRRDRVTLTLSQAIDTDAVSPRDLEVTAGDRSFKVRRVRPAGDDATTRDVYLYLSRRIPPGALDEPLRLAWPGFRPADIAVRDALSDRAVAPTHARLGPDYHAEHTIFRTWSPVSSRAELLLYESATAAEPNEVVPMNRGQAGQWQAYVEGDLHGRYYQYRFHSYGQARTVADIHAFAATRDSTRSMVVDLDRTDPDGWDEHPIPKLNSPADEVIYEIHVRDYSVSDPNVPEAHRGKYLGMTHHSPGGEGKVSTSLTHLKELGVTAVHLLPIQDFGAAPGEYNWGYWTTLFNVPESQYSTTPEDPANTIRELKQTIQTLHEHDIRVIMDVVYNHTSSSWEWSAFDQTVPWHYFRTTRDGHLRNDAGVGNSIADERPMVRKYIIDSLLFWADEYKIDGFRFDLLGTHHPETMRAIARELHKLRPDLTIYGEPWTGGGPTYFLKGAQRGMGVAVFNDHIRNAVRGDLDGTHTGFATGPGGDLAAVRRGVAGAIDDFADAPTESVNYVSAHDNRTFWDKIEHSHDGLDDATKRSMVKLAHGIVLTSQGVAFIHGGADYARTKGGHHNSYNAGDAVNQFDWARKAEYRDVHDYLAGLIDIRRPHPALRLRSAREVRRALSWRDAPHGVLAYTLNGRRVGDTWGELFVAYNGEPDARRVSLPDGDWAVVADADTAGTQKLRTVRGSVELPGYSLVIAYRE